jgi:hypothetical protein
MSGAFKRGEISRISILKKVKIFLHAKMKEDP